MHKLINRTKGGITPPERFNPENSRWFTYWYFCVILIALTVLFRDFVFSSHMLNSNDIISSGVFHRQFLRDSLLSLGRIPSWNPFILCGLPFVDAIHGGTLYPLTIIDLMGDIPRMVGMNFMFHFLLAGLFTYMTARQLRLGKIASAFAGISYMFSPCLISWVAPGHDGKIFVATWLPLAIFFLDRMFERKGLLNATMLGLVLALIILTPHLQLASYVIAALVAFAVYRGITEYVETRSGRRCAWMGLLAGYALVLGLAVSSIQLLPSFTYLTNYSPRSDGDRGYEWASLYSQREEEALSQIVPEFCGANLRGEHRSYWGKNSFKDNSESVGLIPCFLALLSLILKGRRTKYFWAGLATVVFVYALGSTTPVFRLILAVVPFADTVRAPSSSMFLFAFAVSILGAIGLQNLMTMDRSKQESRWKTLQWVGWGSVAVAVLVAVPFTLFGDLSLQAYARLFHPGIEPVGETVSAKWVNAIHNLPNLQVGLWLAVGYLIATSILINRIFKSTKRYLWVLAFPFLVLAADCRFDSRFVTTVDPNIPFGKGELPKFLVGASGENRAAIIGAPARWLHLDYHGVMMTSGDHDKAPRWYMDLIGGRRQQHSQHPRIVNLTGCRHVIVPVSNKVPLDTLGPLPLIVVDTFENWIVYENQNCLPRAFLVDRYEVIPDRKDIYPLVLDGTADLRQLVYLEEEPVLDIARDPQAQAYARIKHYGVDSIAIEIDCSDNMLLILTDNYYPAWQAFVDGSPRKIYRAYGSFRAVEIPADTREVTFKYDSKTYRLGKLLTVFGLVVAFGVLLSGPLNKLRLRRR